MCFSPTVLNTPWIPFWMRGINQAVRSLRNGAVVARDVPGFFLVLLLCKSNQGEYAIPAETELYFCGFISRNFNPLRPAVRGLC
jgi:hypothetical protein